MIRTNTYTFTQEEINYLTGLYNQVTATTQHALYFIENSLKDSTDRLYSREYDSSRIYQCHVAHKLQVFFYKYMERILNGKEQLIIEEYPGKKYYEWLEMIKKEEE